MQDEVKLFVPGRLCLFGEHSDWASEYRKENKNIEKGYTIVATINQGIYATCKKCEKFIFKFDSKKIILNMNMNDLSKEKYNDEFFSCVISTTRYMLENYKVNGIDINIDKMDLPMGVGLSSSSAICVLVVKAFNEIYNLGLSNIDIMDISYYSEREADFKCGRMDHVCALNKKLVKMTFDTGNVKIEEIKSNEKMYFVFCEIKKKNTRKILESLNEAYPNTKNEYHQRIQEAFGIDNKKIVFDAISYIENSELIKLGDLMIEAQKLFDEKVSLYLDCEFREDKLHEIVSNEQVNKYILGAKGVGSHGDGSVQFLVKNKYNQTQLVKTLHNLGYKAYKLNI